MTAPKAGTPTAARNRTRSTDEYTAGERRIEREPLVKDCTRPVEDADVRPAAGTGAGDDLGAAVAVDVHGVDHHAATEGRGVGEELPEYSPGRPAERAHVRPTAGPRARDDVRLAVAVDVGRRDGHASGEPRIIGAELE